MITCNIKTAKKRKIEAKKFFTGASESAMTVYKAENILAINFAKIIGYYSY
jgi:hypothetical protein